MEIKSFSSQNSGQVKLLCASDKSLTHRAIIFACIAQGESSINNPLMGEDCLRTLEAFRSLGVEVKINQQEPQIHIKSRGLTELVSPQKPIDCGNSGTTARLLLGLFTSLPQLQVQLIGDKSLSSRPMDRVVQPLIAAGANVTGEQGAKYLPLKIQGARLKPRHYQINKATAQVKSAILLANLQTQAEITISLPTGSRDHTEQILKSQGACIHWKSWQGVEKITFQGPFKPSPGKFQIPVDPSSAAFFCVAGLLKKNGSIILSNILNNPTRLGFLKVLQRMHASIVIYDALTGGVNFMEPVVDLTVKGGGELKAVTITKEQIPTLVDEIPILAVAAAFAKGESRFEGLEELRIKESDRLQATADLLKVAGIVCSIIGDTLIVQGQPSPAQPFQYHSRYDHRMAMAGAILAKMTDSEQNSEIQEAECVQISFPNFYQLLRKID